jgi:drug/metabolite transporter (DMT)-like permease
MTGVPAPERGEPRTATRFDPRLIAALAAVYVIWSSTYLAIRICVRELPPLGMGAVRFSVAGGILLAIARRRGAAWPARRAWLDAVPVGVLLFVCSNGFVAIAETSISSSGAAVVCATMPLWAGVLGTLGGDRPTAREWASLAIGFAGVVVLFGSPSLAGPRAHVVLLLLSPPAWAIGSIRARRVPAVAPAGSPGAELLAPALQMIAGGALLAVVAVARGERVPAAVGAAAWLALAYLTLAGSVIGFTAYGWLLRHARPAVATSYAFVNPVLAVVLGAALYGEPLGITTVIANLMIVAAVMLVLARPRPRPA